MKEIDVQMLVEKVSVDYFDRPFLHKAMFNKRLRTTGGRYLLKSHNIELNYHYYKAYGEEGLIEVIKHELCHYHLHIMGKGYRHRDKDFRVLLKQVGAPRFCKSMKEDEKEEKRYTYKCKNCQFQYERRRKVDTKRYVCGKCRGKLELCI